MDESIRRIQDYVYSRYVESKGNATLDGPELQALDRLEGFFAAADRADDPDCFMAGVLAFELAFEVEREEQRESLFRRAKRWLDRYRALTGEPWDVVDDRLADIDGYFEQRGISPDAAPAEPTPEADAPVVPLEVSYAQKEIEDHGPMMFVPAGPFLFGAQKRPVTLPAFFIDKFPVTNRQFEQFCRATSYRFPKYIREERFAHPDAPVVGVSIADVQKFARWVGKTLPTEEQWEKASRGVDGRVFPWGDAPADAQRACHGRDPAKEGTQPVTLTGAGASPYGVRDLAGNVWEWTNTAVEDGETLHVIKGGCYNDPPELLRTDLRLEAGPKDKYETIGFRLVKSA